MNEDIRQDVAEAHTRFAAAEALIAGGFHHIAVANIYYACLNYLKALLRTKGTAYQTHKGVLIGFDKLFIKEGAAPAETGAFLRRLVRERLNADYAGTHFSEADVRVRLTKAKEFAAFAEDYLAPFLK